MIEKLDDPTVQQPDGRYVTDLMFLNNDRLNVLYFLSALFREKSSAVTAKAATSMV